MDGFDSTLVLMVVFVWVVFCVGGPMWLAGQRGRNSFSWGCLGFFIGPFALLLLGFAPSKTSEKGTKKCPKCAELIKEDALVCRFCKHEFSELVRAPVESAPVYLFMDCPHCERGLKIRETYRGKAGQCNHCGGTFEVPLFVELPNQGQRGKHQRARLVAVFALLVIVLFGGQGYVYYRDSTLAEGDHWVYFSNKDRYYFYDLCPRAVSLGLNEDSKQYRESELKAKGYSLVPADWRDLDIAEQRKEAARLAEEAAKAKAEYDEYARQQAALAEQQFAEGES